MRRTQLSIALSLCFIGRTFGGLPLSFGIAFAGIAFAQTPALPPAVSSPSDTTANLSKIILYTSFDPQRLAPVFNDFQKSQNITIQIESDQADLILGRLLREGATSAADAALLPTLTRVERAAAAELLMPMPLLGLEKPIPAAYHDSSGHWVALTGFVRMLVVHSERVKPGEITHYDDLAKPALKGRLCLPPLGRLAARAFLAAQMIPDPLAAETWVKGATANAIPLPPADRFAPHDASDRGLLQALIDGKCDVALVNSQTLARLSDRIDDPLRPALDKLSASFPTLGEGRGTPVEIIAIGATRASAHRDAVIKLIAFLTSDSGQRLLAEALWGYPLKPGIPLSNPVSRWGPFKADPTPLSLLLPLLPQAAALAARTGSL